MEASPTAPTGSICSFKELRVDLEPVSPNSFIQIQLPSTSAFSRSSRVLRTVTDAPPACKTEDEFRRWHIASSGNVFFRSASRYPHSILWRCLGSNILELRSLDLSKNENESKEGSLVLQLGFPSPITPNCIDLADSPEKDAFNLFVLTKNNDLYTLTLPSTFLCRSVASEADIGSWCKVFRPASLAISHAHRLQAQNSQELTCALADGRLLRLVRKAGDDGATWDEVAYNDGQWGSSLRGLIRWQGSNTVRYEGHSLDQNTALATALSPDGEHIFAVGLNHTLKAWNVASGKQTVSKDLLDVHREPNEISRIMLDPGSTRVLSINRNLRPITGSGDKYYVFTFSPHGSGVFKIWAIRDANHPENEGVRDLFPDIVLRIPDPDDGAHWTMADFKVTGHLDSAQVDVWVLLRLNKRYKLYYKMLTELQDIEESWQTGWKVTAIDTAKREPCNEMPSKRPKNDSRDTTGTWLEYIFTPGRLPESVLATALSIYTQDRPTASAKNIKTNLAERIASAVTSQEQLESADNAGGNPTRARDGIYGQWLGFWNIVTELDQSRFEPLSLAIGGPTSIPWVVLTGACSAIRDCTETEIFAHNKSKDLLGYNDRMVVSSIEAGESPRSRSSRSELAVLVEAAARFRAGFSSSVRHACHEVLHSEFWQDPSHSISIRIQTFYDRANFASEVGDRQYHDLAASLNEIGGFGGLNTDAILAILESLPDRVSERSHLVSTALGRKVLTRGALEMITLHARIISDLLYLIVFVDVEVDREEYAMDDFDSTQLYTELLDQSRICMILWWLATNSRPSQDETAKEGSELFDAPSGHALTILEDLFAGDIRPQAYADRGESFALTNSIRDLLKWAAGGNETTVTIEHILVNVQCNLLRNGNVDLATSFLQFQPTTAWSTYVRARLCLLRNQLAEAAVYFKKAAFKLSRPLPPSSFYATASAGLLDPLSASFLASGLMNYHTHILNLFSPLRAHAQVSYFAQLALQHCVPASAPSERSDLLARLFHASLALADYDAAYSAMSRYTDPALQRAALAALIGDMVSAGYIDELLSLPFPTLKKDVDAILSAKSREEPLPQAAATAGAAAGARPFYKILYAWRVRQGDFRGAAAVLVSRLDARKQRSPRGRSLGGGGGGGGGGGAKDTVLDEYLVGINALALLGGEEEGWVFVEREDGGRRLKTLADVREAYQEEMDRRERWARGNFPAVGAEESDEDDEEMGGF